jgi:hypothetical protein
MNELLEKMIAKVQEVNEAAAEWLKGDKARFRVITDDLSEAFSWGDTPQGWDYWAVIHAGILRNEMNRLRKARKALKRERKTYERLLGSREAQLSGHSPSKEIETRSPR